MLNIFTPLYIGIFLFCIIVNIQVTTDGYFSFERAVSCCPNLLLSLSTSNYIIAPFETNTNIATGTGRVSYEVHNMTTVLACSAK